MGEVPWWGPAAAVCAMGLVFTAIAATTEVGWFPGLFVTVVATVMLGIGVHD